MALALYMDHHVPRAITIGICIRDLELIAKAGETDDVINKFQFLPL